MTRQFHPLYQARLHLLDAVPAPSLDAGSEESTAREEFGAPFGDANLPEVLVEDAHVPGPNGPIPVRVYRSPWATDPAPALVWMHGGAYMFGDLDMPEADHVARHLAHRASAVVISVDYRLCVDGVHLPVPHDDCYAVVTWVRQSAHELGIDPVRVAVGGASAGAALAATVAVHATQAGQPPWQVLLAYPIVHPDLPEPSDELAEALALVPPALRFPPDTVVELNANALGRPIHTATPYDFAGLTEDLGGMPPTYIENAEFDDLRRSGEAFAEQLRRDGVEVEQFTVAGVPHGHLNAIGLPPADESYDRFAARLLR